MSRQYYKNEQQIYELFLQHPVMSNMLNEFGIDSDYDPESGESTRVRTLSKFLVSNDELISSSNISAFYNDSELIDDICEIYGYSEPEYVKPWSQYTSPKGTGLLELLNYTLYFYKFSTTDNFFEKNLLNFIPEFDREKIKESPKMKLTLESLGRKLDDLDDKISRLKNVYDPDKTPDELLDYLGQNLGYEREDFTLSGFSFRELLKNIIEIYKVKGTNYSFSFFFKFLGFEINLKEFYFNRDVTNPEQFPGVDFNQVEYYLTTQNPIFDISYSRPASHLRQTRNLDDWNIEYNSLLLAGCNNSINYMRGYETYNNNGATWHKNPWDYFKTNLIEYELSPFFDRLNLTSSDNETIRKYVRFLSPTYLFTWININLRPWIEEVNIVLDRDKDWLINITKNLGDLRPTAQPWPAHPQGLPGIPENTTGVFEIKTSNDEGFKGTYNEDTGLREYLDYEIVSNYIAIWDQSFGGDKLTFKINNNMNLGGDDRMGTVLTRNGSHIRQPSHPKHITDAKHNALKRLAFDGLSSNIKDYNVPGAEWIDYSFNSYPAVPTTQIPISGRTIYENNITFSWETTAGAMGYRIQIANNKSFASIIIDDSNISSNSFNAILLNNDRYYWRVKVKNDSVFDVSNPLKWTAWSNIWNFILKIVPFPFDGEVINRETIYAKPTYEWNTGYTQQFFINAEIQFEWERSFTADLYSLEISTNASFTAVIHSLDSIVNRNIVALVNGIYYWRYKERDRESGWNDWSSSRSFTVNFPETI